MITIQKARPEDSEDVLTLSNDRGIRDSSFHPDPINQDSHQQWYMRHISDPDCLFLLARENGILAGQIRLDRVGEDEFVSISIDSRYRGRGIGKALWKQALSDLSSFRPAVRSVIAQIRKENRLSIEFFRKLGFRYDRDIRVGDCPAVQYNYSLGRNAL